MKLKPSFTKHSVIALCLSCSTWAMAQPLSVDWLYLTNAGSWLSRHQTVTSKNTSVPLPLSSVNEDSFWWQTEKPGSQIIWRNQSRRLIPDRGTAVELNGEPGLWLVESASTNMLVLKQGNRLRYWPKEQWHLLAFADNSPGESFTFELIQPTKQRDELSYAWWDTQINAKAQYRLDLDTDNPVLVQELIISNPGAVDIQASGYSYAQSSQPKMMAMRAVMVAESDAVATPQQSQSNGVPLLYSNDPVMLPAGSQQWLPVAAIALTDVTRRYSLSWDTRQTGTAAAQASLLLESNEPMPTLAGEVKVPLFNQQLAMLNSYYRPTSEFETELSLGQSNMVSLKSESRGANRWQLTLENRTDESAEVAMELSHWDGKTNRRVPIKRTLEAQQKVVLNASVNSLGRLEVK